MPLDNDQVEKIAHLARLAISEQERSDYARELSGILEFVDQMNAIDTTNVSPMAHPLDMVQRLRPDRITASVEREHLQSVAPSVEQGLYLVPKVIE
jgi:aspartyl-tRNA(Asn)/glutamyl-tRNA(Gln) amidotransferase subunit C